MSRKKLPLPGIVVLCLSFAGPAFSHEFDLLLLAPTGTSQAEIEDMRVAFLIASHERDTHPDETSEGHLGGLDVQLTLATPDTTSANAALAFVVAPLSLPGDARIAALAAPGDAVIVDALALSPLSASLQVENADITVFADQFRAETGRAPGEAALGAYRAARVVDLAVRTLGSVDDRDALRRTLAP